MTKSLEVDVELSPNDGGGHDEGDVNCCPNEGGGHDEEDVKCCPNEGGGHDKGDVKCYPNEGGGHDEGDVKCSTDGIVVFVLGLVSGTFSPLLCKMAYDSRSIGIDGQEKLFAKPIMMLLLMFAAMAPAGLLYLIQQAFTRKEDRETISTNTLMVLIVPSLCDLLCTLLLLVAQLYITASLWQMMRGSVIIVTAILKRFVLQSKLKWYMWVGVCVITSAMVLVGSTSFFEAKSGEQDNKGRDPRIGVILVVIGCLAQGVQYVFEEKVLSVGAPPLVVIGCIGIWGTILTLTLVYPMAYYLPGNDVGGCYENPWDAVVMIRSSPKLYALTISFFLTVTCYNCAVIYVTQFLSTIWHAILDNFRPVIIWGLDLCLYYMILPGQGYGEVWTQYSWLQLVGLLVLFLGTAIYNGSFPYANHGDKEFVALNGSSQQADPTSMASPALTERLKITAASGKLPISLKDFATLFVEENAPYGFKQYHESVKDTNLEMSEWKEMPSNLGHRREMKFLKPVNLVLLQSTSGIKVQTYQRFGNDGLIVCSSTRLEHVLAADAFSVEDKVAVQRIDDDNVSVEITFEVKFIKPTLFIIKNAIESSTNTEMRKWLEAYFKSLGENVEKARTDGKIRTRTVFDHTTIIEDKEKTPDKTYSPRVILFPKFTKKKGDVNITLLPLPSFGGRIIMIGFWVISILALLFFSWQSYHVRVEMNKMTNQIQEINKNLMTVSSNQDSIGNLIKALVSSSPNIPKNLLLELDIVGKGIGEPIQSQKKMDSDIAILTEELQNIPKNLLLELDIVGKGICESIQSQKKMDSDIAILTEELQKLSNKSIAQLTNKNNDDD